VFLVSGWNNKIDFFFDGIVSAQATEVTLLSTSGNAEPPVSEHRYPGGVSACKIIASYLN
jgi:hypothetical protein